MSTIQDGAAAGVANVVPATGTPTLTGKDAVLVHSINGGDASESTLTTLLTQADFDAKVGEVQATPTANTVLDRLKAIFDKLSAFVVARLSDGAGNAVTSTTVGAQQALDVNIAAGAAIGPTATEAAAIGTTGVPSVGKDAQGNAQFQRISELGVLSIQAGDYAGDADRKQRISMAHTLFSGKILSDKQPLLYVEALTGTGTATFNANKSSVSMTTVAASDKVIRQSRWYPSYQPNKTQKIASTFRFAPAVVGVIQSAGIFDANNGFIVRLNGVTPEIALRSFTTGVVAETVVAQSAWNIDKLDGTGPSGGTIDFTKAQHLVIDYLWLGVGPARIGFRNGGDIVYVHRFNNDNIGTGVYMSTPSLPVRWEIEQTGATGATMEVFCSAVESEGGVQIEGVERGYISDVGTSFSLGQEIPIMSVRLNSARVRDFVKVIELGLFADNKLNASFQWVLNPTITGGAVPVWVVQPDSAVEIDMTRLGTYTPGTGHAMRVGGFSDQSRGSLLVSDRALPIGASVAGASDELVLIVKQRGSNNTGSVYPSIHWVEST